MKYNPALDGLRAVAVLAVVGYHVGLIPAGYVGVDVFFVISGYLITRLLADEAMATGRIDFVAFYARRARRILPALVVVILATLVASTFVLSPLGGQQDAAKSAAASLLFAGNLWFQMHTGGYFDPSTDKMPFLHLWSLGVEEQFYLVWPVVLLLARRKPVVALAVLSGASLLLAEAWLHSGSQGAFYSMPARAWELGIGGLLALRAPRLPNGSQWAGLALTLAACLIPLPHFPGLGALPAVLGAALLIASPPLLTARPLVAVGLISYSLYLWHWPALALLRATSVGVPPLPHRLWAVGLAFVLAFASYRYVETPFRRLKGRRRIVIVGVACSLILSLGAFTYSTKPAGPSLRERTAIYASVDRPHAALHCAMQYDDPNTTPTCTPQSVTIYGDSMALAWAPFAEGWTGQKVGVFTRYSCPPSLSLTRHDAHAQACLDYNRKVVAAIQQGKVDTLILAGWWAESPLYRSGLREVVAALRPHVRHLYVMAQTPDMREPAPECYLRGLDCGVARSSFETQRAAIQRKLAELGVPVIDPADFLCRPDCVSYRGDLVLYWDVHHPTTTTARAFGLSYRGTQPWVR